MLTENQVIILDIFLLLTQILEIKKLMLMTSTFPQYDRNNDTTAAITSYDNLDIQTRAASFKLNLAMTRARA